MCVCVLACVRVCVEPALATGTLRSAGYENTCSLLSRLEGKDGNTRPTPTYSLGGALLPVSPTPSPASTITSFHSHQPPLSPASTITSFHSHQPPLSPASTLTSLHHHQILLSPDSTLPRFRSHQLPLSQASTVIQNSVPLFTGKSSTKVSRLHYHLLKSPSLLTFVYYSHNAHQQHTPYTLTKAATFAIAAQNWGTFWSVLAWQFGTDTINSLHVCFYHSTVS